MTEPKEGDKDKQREAKPASTKPRRRRILKIVSVIGLALVIIVALAATYIYSVSPAAIRNPKMEHYHFRMQVIVDGKSVDFADAKFQMPYEKGQCSAELSEQPIHFHDQKDQFVHIHWAGMTGGLVLKNYGWNFIGGINGQLGYRLDQLPRSIASARIHGRQLPVVPDGAQFWVYTGDEQGFYKRTFGDFKRLDLEQFFGKASNFLTYQAGENRLLAWFFPRAAAHGSEQHGPGVEHETEAERLTRINNLIGNVVIFVQATEPSAEQIKARFLDLEPLSDSTCGG